MRLSPASAGLLTSILAMSCAAAGPGLADEPAPASRLELELNAVQPSDKGCRLTFVVANRLGSPLDEAAFEIVLFDKAGQVDRLTVLDFKDLPRDKTKVRQFDLAGVDCAALSRVLVNDATQCKGAGVAPADCIGKLATGTKTRLDFGS